MIRGPQFFHQLLRYCGAALVSFVVWTFWLGLTIILGVQIFIVVTSDLPVPAWLMTSIERRLEPYGLKAKFGRTSFDPSGSVFVENVSLILPSLNEPIVTAGGVFVRFDPWTLALGKFEASELRVTGANWLVPAMTSSTGRSERLVRDFEATIRPGGDGEIVIDALNARLANLSVNARGSIYLPVQSPGAEKPLPTAEFLAQRYAVLCRQLIVATAKLEALEEPSVEVEIDPSESRGAIASIVLHARSLKLDDPLAVQATGLRATARFPLTGETPVMVRFEVGARELRLPRDALARGVKAQMRGSLKPALLAFSPTEIEISADSIEAEGISAAAFAGRFMPGPLPRLDADVVAQAMGSPLTLQAHADFSAQSARLRFDGRVAPAWLDVISRRVGRDVRKWVDFPTPAVVSEGTVTLGERWKFERLTSRIHAWNINAYRVTLDEAEGRVELTPERFLAPEARVRLGGENFAYGSYEQILATRDFRFLLEGSLEPLVISGWFAPWWTNFFKNTFDFSAGPPRASVDVRGRWREGRRTSTFVFADVNSPVIRGAKLDRARSLLFIRPGYFEGLETFGTLETGLVRGTFIYEIDPATTVWQRFDFEGTSSLDLDVSSQLIGPVSSEWFRPFKFERPPAVKVKGGVRRDAAGTLHHDVQIDGKSESPFRFYEFPLERVTFKAVLHDDQIMLEEVEAGAAGGIAKGTARIWGTDLATRRLRFDFSLREASFGRAVGAMEEFFALRDGVPIPPPGKFIRGKNHVRFDMAATAEGLTNDFYSYRGRGVADLAGAELGEVRLLGGLSETLRFTALRFTAVNANFNIEGRTLVFPEVTVTGNNSAIHAHGDYALDRKQLDFNAKVFPFQESGFILKKILDVALSPLSNVFEVKLTGTLDKPSWGLVLGPTNFLRSLTQPDVTPIAPKSTEPSNPPAAEPLPSVEPRSP
jgi:hypothetical protein